MVSIVRLFWFVVSLRVYVVSCSGIIVFLRKKVCSGFGRRRRSVRR